MVYKYREILSNRNAIFSLCETSCEAQFRPDVTSFFVGWCTYEKFQESSAPPLTVQNYTLRSHHKWFSKVPPGPSTRATTLEKVWLPVTTNAPVFALSPVFASDTASSSGASIQSQRRWSRRARSTRNWGRAREGSREGERREAKRLQEFGRSLGNFVVFL